MKRASYIVGVLALVCLTLAGGMMHGRASGRWGGNARNTELAELLKSLPRKIGPWELRVEQPLAESVEQTLECAGYVNGQFENQETGEVVTAFVLLGPAGPISVHTPDVCYSSREFAVRQSPSRVPLGVEGQQNEFWVTTLQSTQLDASYLRVYYAWSTGGAWSAPNDARFTFAGKPYLYKIQLAERLPADSRESPDACQSLLKALLPLIKDYMAEPEKDKD